VVTLSEKADEISVNDNKERGFLLPANTDRLNEPLISSWSFGPGDYFMIYATPMPTTQNMNGAHFSMTTRNRQDLVKGFVQKNEFLFKTSYMSLGAETHFGFL
jgi:hypothetical protein